MKPFLTFIKEAKDNVISMGFSIDVGNEDMITANAEDKKIKLDWDKINKGISKIEHSILQALKADKKNVSFLRDEGHGSDGALVGSIDIVKDSPLAKAIQDEKEGSSEPWSTGKGNISKIMPDKKMFSGVSKDEGSDIIDVQIDFFDTPWEK